MVTRRVDVPALRIYTPRAEMRSLWVPASSVASLMSCPRMVNSFTVTLRGVATYTYPSLTDTSMLLSLSRLSADSSGMGISTPSQRGVALEAAMAQMVTTNMVSSCRISVANLRFLLHFRKHAIIKAQGWRMRFNSNSVKNSPDYVK